MMSFNLAFSQIFCTEYNFNLEHNRKMKKGKLSKQCIKEVIGMDDRLVMLVSIPTLAFFIPLIFFNASLSNGLIAYLPKAIVSLVYTITYWTTVRAGIIYFRRRYPNYKQTMRRLFAYFLVITPLYIVINYTFDYAKAFLLNCLILEKLEIKLTFLRLDVALATV